MECQLCKEDKQLIKAHILPEFFFKNLNLYFPDQKGQGRIHKATFNDKYFHYNPKGESSSLYDPNILCKDCDNFINEEYENYSKILLFDESKGEIFKDVNGIIYVKFQGIDYTRFKLFVISVFWRGSISNKMHRIKFSESDEETLRQMLRTKNAKEEENMG